MQFGTSLTQEDEEFSPMGAVLVKVTPDPSVYGSYTSSFQPTSDFSEDPQGNPLGSTEGEQWEIEVKQDFFDGDLFATLSVFNLVEKNSTESNPTGTGSIQIGEAETNDIEVEIKGRVTDDLRITAAYTYLDNEFTSTLTGNEGNALSHAPEHAASAFVMYDAYKTSDERLSVGGGIFPVNGLSGVVALSGLKSSGVTAGGHYRYVTTASVRTLLNSKVEKIILNLI